MNAKILTIMTAALVPTSASAGPTAEIAKRCMHYSYIVYPYKRPGSVRGSSERQTYFKDCMSKQGNVPEPTSVKP